MIRIESPDDRHRKEIHLDNIISVAANALINNYAPHSKAFNQCSRDISNTLYDYPCVYTGYASRKALATKYYYNVVLDGKTYHFTKDHIWPRQYSGDQIILSALQRGVIVRAAVEKLIQQFVQVRYVTADENNRLMKFQNSKEFEHPDIAYNSAGVNVVLWPPHTRITRLPEVYPELVVSDLSSINNIS